MAAVLLAPPAVFSLDAGAAGDQHDEAIWQLKVRHHNENKIETIEIKLHKQWTPAGFQRVLDLVSAGFFKDLRFFRTIRGFMSQFGLSGNPALNSQWQDRALPVEEGKQSNSRGMVTFAMDGRKRRTTQLFINTVDNRYLDTQGFAPVGEVIGGMSVVDGFYSGYGEAPKQNLISTEGNKYLDANFPQLSQLIESKITFPDGSVSTAGGAAGMDAPTSASGAASGGAAAAIDHAAEAANKKPPTTSWLPSIWTLLFLGVLCFFGFRSRKKIAELMFGAERLPSSKGSVIGSSPRRGTPRDRDFAL